MVDIWDGSETDTYYSQRREITLSIQKKTRKVSDLDKLILATRLLAEEVEELQHRVKALEKGEIYNGIQEDDVQSGNEVKKALS